MHAGDYKALVGNYIDACWHFPAPGGKAMLW